MAKAHSSIVADLYVQSGWIIRTELRADPNDEPYEYLLEWPRNDDPVYPVLPKS
jgi:hypothetical protein